MKNILKIFTFIIVITIVSTMIFSCQDSNSQSSEKNKFVGVWSNSNLRITIREDGTFETEFSAGFLPSETGTYSIEGNYIKFDYKNLKDESFLYTEIDNCICLMDSAGNMYIKN